MSNLDCTITEIAESFINGNKSWALNEVTHSKYPVANSLLLYQELLSIDNMDAESFMNLILNSEV